jgi:uncharacterized protein YecT (DUF1311 family)
MTAIRVPRSLFLLPLASICLVALSGHVFAQDEEDLARPYKNRCSTGPMLEMTKCLDGELKQIEQRLRSTQQRLAQSLLDRDSFERAQTAWKRFRKLECEFSISGIGKDASLYSFAGIACQIELDLRRIRDLERYISWNGGAGAPATKK